MGVAELLLSLEDYVVRPFEVEFAQPPSYRLISTVNGAAAKPLGAPTSSRWIPAASRWHETLVESWEWNPSLDRWSDQTGSGAECLQHPQVPDGLQLFELQPGNTTFAVPPYFPASALRGFELTAVLYYPSANFDDTAGPFAPWSMFVEDQFVLPDFQWYGGDRPVCAIAKFTATSTSGSGTLSFDSSIGVDAKVWVYHAEVDVEEALELPRLGSRLPANFWIWAPILPIIMLTILLIALILHLRRRCARRRRRANEPRPSMTTVRPGQSVTFGPVAIERRGLDIPVTMVNGASLSTTRTTPPPSYTSDRSLSPTPPSVYEHSPPLSPVPSSRPVSPSALFDAPYPRVSRFAQYPSVAAPRSRHSPSSRPTRSSLLSPVSPDSTAPTSAHPLLADPAMTELVDEMTRAGFTVRSLIAALRIRPGVHQESDSDDGRWSRVGRDCRPRYSSDGDSTSYESWRSEDFEPVEERYEKSSNASVEAVHDRV